MFRPIIFALFFGSGMAGLIYQVVWTKLLTLTFGVTLLAVSTVLTCFFGGLALGSYVGGRWIDRHGNGFKWYGVAEVLIGVYALVFLGLLSIDRSVYVMVAQQMSLGFFGLNLLKFVLAAFLLIIPTTLMGATLPILSRTLARASSHFALNIGGLYSVNTVGAVAGAVLTAFVFIPTFGLNAILIATGVFNIVIGALAYQMGRVYVEDPIEDTPPIEEPLPVPHSGAIAGLSTHFTGVLLWGFAISGFTGLAYEVIWTRVLGFMLTGTVYAFAAVLAVFLTGIATGSFVFSAFIDRVRSRGTLITILALVELLIGISSIALVTLYDRMPGMEFYSRIDSTRVWSEFVYLNFFAPFITLIIPTFLFGATFPLVCKIYSWRVEGVGTKIGNIYSVNTVGGILGSFITGFVLVPYVGMQNTIVLIGLVNIAIGAAFILGNPFARKRARAVFLGAGAVATAVVLFTLPANMPLSLHKSFLTLGEEIVFYKGGSGSTVTVQRPPTTRGSR
jgi:spermidine synthase